MINGIFHEQMGSNWIKLVDVPKVESDSKNSMRFQTNKIREDRFLVAKVYFRFFLMFSFGMYFGVFSKSAYSSCLYTTIEFNAGWSFQSILKLLANWGSSSRFQTCEGWKFKIL